MSLHARQNSIKRTPSDLSRELGEADLPPPSILTSTHRRQQSENQQKGVTDELDKLELEEPEGERAVQSSIRVWYTT